MSGAPFARRRTEVGTIDDHRALAAAFARIDDIAAQPDSPDEVVGKRLTKACTNTALRILGDRPHLAAGSHPHRWAGTLVMEWSTNPLGWDVVIDVARTGAVTVSAIRPHEDSSQDTSTTFPSAGREFGKHIDRLTREPKSGRIKATRTECGTGHAHDSKLEARRCDMLTGDPLVEDLRQQVPFAFLEAGRECFRYIADFVYRLGGVEVVEDAKGMRTDVYRLKRKLVEARFGIRISEWPIPKKELARLAKVAERERKAAAKLAAKAERDARRATARNIAR